jgi:hypothetical protein
MRFEPIENAHISTAQRIICWNLMTRRKVKSCLKPCSLAPFKKMAGMVQKQFAVRRVIQKWMVSQQELSESNQPCGSI